MPSIDDQKEEEYYRKKNHGMKGGNGRPYNQQDVDKEREASDPSKLTNKFTHPAFSDR